MNMSTGKAGMEGVVMQRQCAHKKLAHGFPNGLRLNAKQKISLSADTAYSA